MRNYLAQKEKDNCCVCDNFREEFIKSHPDKVKLVTMCGTEFYDIIEKDYYMDFVESRAKEGVRFVSDDPWHSNFFCMSCILTLVNNPTRTHLTKFTNSAS